MATAKLRQTNAELLERVQETHRIRKWFIFAWWEKIHEERMGNDLFITTDEQVDRIFLNGDLISGVDSIK